MAAEPADLSAKPVVPRAGSAPWWEDAQDHHRRTLARKLLIALWRYITAGVVTEGAVMKAAAATI
jgi:hypothetical protein